jgi:quercetin dioxygenase-like cupin family protein
MDAKSCIVRPDSVPPYSPRNHEDTVNQRLIGAENVGAKQLEVILGTVQKGGGALKHSHPGIEQVCYMLEGRARVEIGDEVAGEVGPGDTVFFPPGVPHVLTTISDEPARVLVVYAPPYGETGAVRH